MRVETTNARLWCPNYVSPTITVLPTFETPGIDKCTARLTDEDAQYYIPPVATTASGCLRTNYFRASARPGDIIHLTMTSGNAPSVAEVVAQAGNYTYNAHIPLTNWLRTASTMQKEVCYLGCHHDSELTRPGASLRSRRQRCADIPVTLSTCGSRPPAPTIAS